MVRRVNEAVTLQIGRLTSLGMVKMEGTWQCLANACSIDPEQKDISDFLTALVLNLIKYQVGHMKFVGYCCPINQ